MSDTENTDIERPDSPGDEFDTEPTQRLPQERLDEITWSQGAPGLDDDEPTAKLEVDSDEPMLIHTADEDDSHQPRFRGWWLLAPIAIVLIALGFWWWWERPDTPPPPSVSTNSSSITNEPARSTELPSLDASDAFLRQLVGQIAAHPTLAKWLASESLVRNLVASTEILAEGQLPRDSASSLVPQEAFSVTASGTDTWRPSAGSRGRFEDVLAVLQVVDPADAARIAKTIAPLCDEARRELGYPEGNYRSALDRAVAHLVRVSPQIASEPLIQDGEIYRFADPDLEESLSPAQKALLRMGSEQAAWVQGWLHRFHDALAATD